MPADASSSVPAYPVSSQPATLVEHFFRHETGRLHGALIRLLGVHHLALAEDIAQEAMLKALHAWSMGGIPPNPPAWITQVAMNLGRDALRHRRMADGKEAAIGTHFEQAYSTPALAVGAAEEIRDDTLRLLFICCHPSVTLDAQVVLALKVLCGFTTGEIARAFLSGEAAIEKQLTRTRQRIQESNLAFALPPAAELPGRLDGVLAALYLLFNEGYKASAGERLLREDLCGEAIRLMNLLVAQADCGTPPARALLALMLLTAARFPARVDENGDILRLDDQDRGKWDQAMIARGLHELMRATAASELSEYHLQAGIAALHCTARDSQSTDWARILRHYDALYVLRPTPIVALNRAVAVAQVEGPAAALAALAAIPRSERFESHYLLHAVTGEMRLRLGDRRAAAESFGRARALAQVGPEQLYLTRMLERASEGPDQG